ncbi:MAG: FMN reductase [Lapillicoccus sp.]
MATRTVAVVSAGLSQPSSTRLLADRLAEATRQRLAKLGDDMVIETIELRDQAQAITNHLLTGFPSEGLRAALDTVRGADAVIAVTPIFTASYSGLFKSFLDVLEPDSLVGTPVLLGATGGTARHSLAIDYAMRPLFAYLKATVAPTAVFAASEDWASADEGGLGRRIDTAGREFAELVAGSARPVPVDPFGAVTPFERLLADHA